LLFQQRFCPEDFLKAIERAINILNSGPIPRLKEMYDFITESKREDAFFRAILWLKREGFISSTQMLQYIVLLISDKIALYFFC
jgi:hypothetical protein